MKLHKVIIWLIVILMIICETTLASTNADDQKKSEEKQDFYVVTKNSINLTGFTQVRYKTDENDNNSFDVRRARLCLKGKLSKHLNYKLQNEFGGTKQKLLDAELSFVLNPRLKLRAGQFKIPFSQESLISVYQLDFINWSQTVDALSARGKDIIGNQCGRDIGFEMSGSFDVFVKRPLFEYALGIFNGSGINTVDMNKQKDLVGRLVFFPLSNLAISGSFYSGKYTLSTALDEVDKRERYCAGFIYDYSMFSLMAEYLTGCDGSIKKTGWYAQTGYYILPQKLQGIFKYDQYDPDVDVSENGSTIYTFGVNYYFSKISKLQINYELIDEQGSEKANNMLITQLQFGF